MNRNQAIALGVAAANLVLLGLFPPVDEYAIANAKLPVFAGFQFVLGLGSNAVINTGVLALAAIVVAINAGIAGLLLREPPPGARRRGPGLQGAVLAFTGVNLVLVLLFPPFESVFALTHAAIPTFEGFYFIFDRRPMHTIVTTLLYLEVALILANGALLWLIFGKRGRLAPEEAIALAARLRAGNPR